MPIELSLRIFCLRQEDGHPYLKRFILQRATAGPFAIYCSKQSSQKESLFVVLPSYVCPVAQKSSIATDDNLPQEIGTFILVWMEMTDWTEILVVDLKRNICPLASCCDAMEFACSG
jgi:hypothetical protein